MLNLRWYSRTSLARRHCWPIRIANLEIPMAWSLYNRGRVWSVVPTTAIGKVVIGIKGRLLVTEESWVSRKNNIANNIKTSTTSFSSNRTLNSLISILSISACLFLLFIYSNNLHNDALTEIEKSGGGLELAESRNMRTNGNYATVDGEHLNRADYQ